MQTIVGNIYKYVEQQVSKYFVYLGDSDDASVIIGGEVGLKDNSRQHVTIDGLSMVVFVDKPIFIKRKKIISPLRLQGNNAAISSQNIQSLITGIVNYYIDNYRNSIINTINDNYDALTDCLLDLVLGEKLTRLLDWNQIKKRLKFDVNVPQMPKCYKYGIYFAYLGTNVGSELNKLRPVLIWKRHESHTNPIDNSYYVFPLSSKIPTKSFTYNVTININGKDNVIHLNDGRRISGLRILKPLVDDSTGKMYILKDEDRLKVKEAIKEYFNL